MPFGGSWKREFYIKVPTEVAVQALSRPADGSSAQRLCRGERKVKGNFQEEHLSSVAKRAVSEETAHLVRGDEAPKKQLGLR